MNKKTADRIAIAVIVLLFVVHLTLIIEGMDQ